jgi:putative addiction module component (TIGR02574 family)
MSDRWADTEDPLTNADKALLKTRLALYEKAPDAGSSWKEVETRIRARLVQ